jgi:hypothetical protein
MSASVTDTFPVLVDRVDLVEVGEELAIRLRALGHTLIYKKAEWNRVVVRELRIAEDTPPALAPANRTWEDILKLAGLYQLALVFPLGPDGARQKDEPKPRPWPRVGLVPKEDRPVVRDHVVQLFSPAAPKT